MKRYRDSQLEHVVELFQARAESAAQPPTGGPLTMNESEVLWGPVSLDWLLRSAKLPGKTIVVAIALLFLRGRSGFAQVALRAKLICRMGLSRQTAYRALQHLEDAGLISVNRQRGRAPRVMFQGLEYGNLSSDRKPA